MILKQAKEKQVKKFACR